MTCLSVCVCTSFIIRKHSALYFWSSVEIAFQIWWITCHKRRVNVRAPLWLFDFFTHTHLPIFLNSAPASPPAVWLILQILLLLQYFILSRDSTKAISVTVCVFWCMCQCAPWWILHLVCEWMCVCVMHAECSCRKNLSTHVQNSACVLLCVLKGLLKSILAGQVYLTLSSIFFMLSPLPCVFPHFLLVKSLG